MKMLVATVMMEVIAIIITYFANYHTYKHKIVKRIMKGLNVLAIITCVFLIINYKTVFWVLEIMVYITFFVIFEAVFFQKKVDNNEENATINKEKIKRRVALFLIILIVDGVCTFFTVSGFWRNIRFSDELEIVTTVEEISIPEGCQAVDANFVCIHNAEEEMYYLYYICLNQIYEVASFSESQIDVIFSLERESTPYVEKLVETSYKMNYNFEKYQKPSVKDTKEKVTYKLYIPEGTLKEYYDLRK